MTAEGRQVRSIRSRIARVTSGAGLAFLLAVIPGAASSPGPRPECLDFWAEARYRNYGYDHIVHIANRCAAPAICDVSTNVNPNVQRVMVPPKEEVEVLTFRGSPSREFIPAVECRLVLDE